jgi:hypothetical protein
VTKLGAEATSRIPRLLLLTVLVLLCACSASHTPPSSASSSPVAPEATATTHSVRLYRFSDIGKPRTPTLRKEDRLTLDDIVKPLGSTYRRDIWWGYQATEKSASTFVVVYARDTNPNTAGTGSFFVAVNKGCNVVFNPISNTSHASPECFTFPLRVYRVDAIGQLGQPHLSGAQLAWIARIRRTPYFAKRLNRLQYVMMNLSIPNPYMPGPPLVVVLEETPDWGWLIMDHQAHNEPCNPAYYYENNGFNEKPPGCEAKNLPSPVR